METLFEAMNETINKDTNVDNPGMTEDISMISAQVAAGNLFRFKGCCNILLSKKCFICDQERFTNEQITRLSKLTLTQKEFCDNFDFRFASMIICHKSHCRQHYLCYVGEIPTYDFSDIWYQFGGSIYMIESGKTV